VAKKQNSRVHERWAAFRFSVIGGLLAAPPRKGELRAEIEALAAQEWQHPITGEPVRFSYSTIERWFYDCARGENDPVGALRRKARTDAGHQTSMTDAVRQALLEQYEAHKNWSVALQRDNLVALAGHRRELQPVPSYSTVRRFFRNHGLEKRRRLTSRQTSGAQRAEKRLADREVRGYEVEFVGQLFHWDGHYGSLKILVDGQWETPILIAVKDDRSRLICHMQWFRGSERAEIIAHCLTQAFQKRGLPRSAISDNGSAMIAAEIVEGFGRLGIKHERILPYSAYANGKSENAWSSVEGRLLAMLERVEGLTLELLNEATQAWVELEYNARVNEDTGEAPLKRFLAGPSVLRPAPDSAALRLAFTRAVTRTQRRSDGTVPVGGRRFEIPNRYRHLTEVEIRYASWDLNNVHLVDRRTGHVLCRLFPQDKVANASRLRRPLEPIADPPISSGQPVSRKPAMTPVSGIAPLLADLMARQAATGLPPAYLPMDDDGTDGADGDTR
jgi:transposase InsO family protein